MSRLTETIFYAGDFNVDLLDPDTPPKDGRSLLDMLEIFGFDCLITKVTWKTKTSETLLDLILTSNEKKTLISDVVDTQISDLSLDFTIVRSTAPRSRSRKICLQSFKNVNQDEFIQDLQMAPPFSMVDVFDEVNNKLNAFEQLYSEILLTVFRWWKKDYGQHFENYPSIRALHEKNFKHIKWSASRNSTLRRECQQIVRPRYATSKACEGIGGYR